MSVVVASLEVARLSDAELDRFRALLPADELASATRMRDARLHLSARAFFRESLSRVHREIAPHEWTFARTDAGKPYVTGPAARLSRMPEASLSHTEGLVAVAVADAPVGVDVEPLARAPEVLETVRLAFAPAELAALSALPTAEQGRRAVELWTVKEAYLKALGTGISRHLDRFAVMPLGGGAWRIDESDAWRVHVRVVAERWIVAIAAGANASIAVAGRP